MSRIERITPAAYGAQARKAWSTERKPKRTLRDSRGGRPKRDDERFRA